MQKPGKSSAVNELIEALTGRPELSGSRNGTFTGILVNQLAGAIFAGVKPDPEMVAALHVASQVALQGIAPTDPVEGMFAAQMVATHFAAMECYRRAAIPEQSFEGRRMSLDLGNKLVRSYAGLAEALNKHRGKGQQIVRVEHVTVEAGGQAIVGNVGRGGSARDIEEQPHAKDLPGDTPKPALRSKDPQRSTVPIACREREAPLPHARRSRR